MRSIRAKLTLAALAPLAVAMAIVTVLGFSLINAWIVGEAQKKVRNDLEAARAEYNQQKYALRDALHFAAHTAGLIDALERMDRAGMQQRLTELMAGSGMDVLTLTDAGATAVARAGNPEAGLGMTLSAPYVKAALEGEVFTGTVLMSAAQMEIENPLVARRARLRLVESLPGRDRMENRGMFLLSAYPLRGADGQILGCLYGGVLLNRNLDLVDRIKSRVYGAETYGEKSLGSATIFLGDVRVATTVRLRNGERALGTLVSREVAHTVLAEQKPWLDRALVVHDWYLTAYEPILDRNGNAIGALYVGLLEAPYRDLRTRAAGTLMLILVVTSALGYLLARQGSKRLSRPILELEEMAQRVAHGERHVDLAVRDTDEVGRLTHAFNHMSRALREREEQLRGFARDLEAKVAERTRLLEEKNQELLHAQEELARSEKLAAIGALAAGVAHEINNPTAIIRGNTELLLMELGAESAGREEAEEVMKQTERIARITANLLAFARRQAMHEERLDVNALLEEILSQLPHQVGLGRITLKKNYQPELPPLRADGGQLRQVFTNLLVNAVEAMGGEGLLLLGTAVEGNEVRVSVTDTGPGIAPAVREKLFNPFFTTKRGGSGLGLSVSYGIVERHGGTIEVESTPGQGATFRVHLPLRS
ncbi:cache domain-containing protein [Geoalkalibacter halelectricus]|uniref:histidine kinase n=2 Tax=Geoalkalibacter halelectricus TaxID=2847045 RepID=A0ABY5ZKA8_9BACT|nr:cache domain-containing protein [Geoalkalibacter halelectricus]MDO3377058.1 cache domain-containing protein [Geoalkalibacter halelectricus]UWZ79488.1 cache domain-containing protein [Geoalkalibacter halelectricus]